MTQEAVAAGLGISLKGYQRFETGRHNPTLDTTGRVAAVLGVAVRDLFAFSTFDATENALTVHDFSALVAAGWRIQRDARSRAGTIEVFDARAAASTQARPMPATLVARAAPPLARHPNPEGLFLLRIEGDSMAPRVVDGDWVLLRRPVQPPWLGKIVLAQQTEPGGDGALGRWWLKRVAALEAPESGGVRVRLESLAPGIATIVLEATDESELDLVAELVEVVRAAGVERSRTP